MVTTLSMGLHRGQSLHLSNYTPAAVMACSAHVRTWRLSTTSSSSSSSRTRSSTPEQQQTADAPGGVALNEDMLAQLRAAQEEAARLKRELAQLQQKASASAITSDHSMSS
jgi:hypothetical protein